MTITKIIQEIIAYIGIDILGFDYATTHNFCVYLMMFSYVIFFFILFSDDDYED